MNWLKQILTGADNETLAIGRVFGCILLFFGIAVLIVEPATVHWSFFTIDQWGTMLSQWQVYLPILVATAGGMIAGTAFTEPKDKP